MTVKEHLEFYARVKGIPEMKRGRAVQKAIDDLNLKDHIHKPAGTLSGGNKRKLSVAMAIIGNPPIILLDEPSAGMDPAARRFMWMVVEKISQRDKKSAVILTTHSMEECEALATKLGIMVRGGIFRCFGTSQHVKNKFGVGYEIEIKVNKTGYEELKAMCETLGFGKDIQAKTGLRDALKQVREAGFDPTILDQVRIEGLGRDLVVEAEVDANSEVRIINLLTYLSVQKKGFAVVDYLCGIFAQVEMLEQCGDFYKLRVPTGGRTIGSLFGILEDQKVALDIQEYSVSQTTLEQIFQMFANQQAMCVDKNAFVFRQVMGELTLLNPDREVLPD